MSKVPQSHDCQAWGATEFGFLIDEGLLRHPCFKAFLDGDSAFNRGRNMVVPTRDVDFDFHQSSRRICIECAFGILVRRWEISWRTSKWILVVALLLYALACLSIIFVSMRTLRKPEVR
mmetsp:Transcript_9457/g.24795  ORF Transcript_9457/g.24795 Transcript_9457/m.24795 type:complete len:119 (-) Transcript_9457:265-621(-)